ncbi:MAG: response regulator [Patescibacteria group bacterium]|jgi:DNA-binding response OmpR family regulator
MSNDSKTILVVEDEEPIRKVIAAALKEEKYDVIEAKDGQDGLELALIEHPDLILLDLIMPKLAGQQVCEKLRKDSWGKDVKIIVLTNLDSKVEKDALIKLKVDDYLVKSNYKLEEIIEKVKKLLLV